MGEVEGPSLSAPEPLRPDHDFSRFDCGKAPLDEWIRKHGHRSEGRSARTFAVCANARPVAYDTLAAGSVTHIQAPSRIRRNTPDPTPVMILGRLAVDRAFAGQGIGRGLLGDAMRRCLAVSREAGIRAMMVHAIDEEAAGFYVKYGFQRFPAEGLVLFLAMEQIARALEG